MTAPARVALIGDPVSASVSPVMQRAAFAAAGLELDYTAVRVGRAELPAAFVELRRRYVGLNVTRPLKEAVIPMLDAVSGPATEAGSVNTVVFADGAARGESTDGAGFLAALARVSDSPVRRALVLGTGGAARAVTAVLRRSGAAVAVAGRNNAAAERLQTDLGVEPTRMQPRALAAKLASADLLVNATPVGGGPTPSATPLPDGVPLHPGLVVFDLVYRPRRTALLERAAGAGCRTVEGIEMLIEQGTRSFELWTGCPAPVEAMRAAAYAGLAEATP
ncbi:MAG: shikimate dehydrogenase family protein [Mycobacteriales bacterium]